MQHDLTQAQCEDVLKHNRYGHLGCIDDGHPYVVPITYIYKDGVLYGFSLKGQKIDIMRKNPNICIQVEQVDSENMWKSVICFGHFEEIADPAQAQTIKLLFAEMHGESVLQHQETPITPIVRSGQQDIHNSIVYQMKPDRMTGKAEG